MPRVDVVVRSEIEETFRVKKVRGMFDLQPDDGHEVSIGCELPDDDKWQIGAVVGPSGSGKSTIAKEHFGSSLFKPPRWGKSSSILDGFPKDIDAKEITQSLTAVGFSSPPAWLRPYRVLSNGEQFRVNLAYALAHKSPLVVFDEFTSVVDRTVAQIGCAALKKAISRKPEKRFVGVSCHYDILEWLEPDWIVDMADGELSRRRLRRPSIELEVYRCEQSVWRVFRHHHYLNTGKLPNGSRCYIGCIKGRPVAWSSIQTNYGQAGRWRLNRTVVLPDFQGIGLGVALSEFVGQQYVDQGFRVSAITSHPAMIRYRNRSPKWRVNSISKTGKKGTGMAANARTSAGRSTVVFEYIGEGKCQD